MRVGEIVECGDTFFFSCFGGLVRPLRSHRREKAEGGWLVRLSSRFWFGHNKGAWPPAGFAIRRADLKSVPNGWRTAPPTSGFVRCRGIFRTLKVIRKIVRARIVD